MRPFADKIKTREEIADACERLRGEAKTIGFTSGAFDLLHAGHAEYLEAAKQHCEILVVAVNTDESVRSYKGPGRPIVPEKMRIRLVAALESVDYAFLFSERRNAANIEAIRPDFYIKAGDYAPSGLTSAPVVEKYGGQAVLIPIKTKISTSELASRAAQSLGLGQETEENREAVKLHAPPQKQAPAVFLDRDGTINREVEYLHEPQKFELLPGAAQGMRRFQDMGYRLVVVTTQAGIGLGYFTKEDFYKVNRAMFRALAPFDVKIDRVYFCPHAVTENCQCRKPETGLFQRAVKDLNIDMQHSIVIGDKTSDIEAAHRLGLTSILVRTGHAGSDNAFETQADYVADSIDDAARWVLEKERKD
ncbi:MAG: D-glycero-beta-D-manno-heptose 1,7-bisphosphate 7-phosphatase [Candidatus Sumerlaeota bacterium]